MGGGEEGEKVRSKTKLSQSINFFPSTQMHPYVKKKRTRASNERKGGKKETCSFSEYYF